MSRLAIAARADVSSAAKPVRDAVAPQRAVVPAMVRLRAAGPPALRGFAHGSAVPGRWTGWVARR